MKKMITLQRPLIVGLTEFHCIHWILPLACAIQHVSGAGQSLFLWYLLTALFRLRAPAPCSVFSNSTHRSAHQTFQPAPFSAPLTCSDFAVWFKLLQPAATKRILVQFSPHSSALVFARWQHHNVRYSNGCPAQFTIGNIHKTVFTGKKTAKQKDVHLHTQY